MAIKIVNPQVVSFSPVSTAEVGQTIKVKTVDENNKPIEWEATDFPEGGGASSWNDLKDKPFGDESVTIEWDGDSTGKVTCEEDGNLYVKVSDLTPELSELVGGTFSNHASEITTITEDMFNDFRVEGIPLALIGEAAMIAYEPFTDFGITEAGIYFLKLGSIYVASLTYGSIKKLDPKYLPDTETNIYTYDSLDAVPADLPDGSFVAVPSEESAGGGLPHVELSSDPTIEGATLTESECEQLTAAIANNRPVLISMSVNSMGGMGCFLFNIYTMPDFGTMLMFVQGTLEIVLVYMDGVWSIGMPGGE